MVALGCEHSCPKSLHPHHLCEYKKLKQIILHMVGFECLNHLMVSPSLNLHLENDKYHT